MNKKLYLHQLKKGKKKKKNLVTFWNQKSGCHYLDYRDLSFHGQFLHIFRTHSEGSGIRNHRKYDPMKWGWKEGTQKMIKIKLTLACYQQYNLLQISEYWLQIWLHNTLCDTLALLLSAWGTLLQQQQQQQQSK